MGREFTKYRERGAYHWRELSLHPFHGWPYTRSRVEWVARQCVSSATILEIGCGDGGVLGRLARTGKTVTGVDSDETALELARAMFAHHGLRGDFHSDLRAVPGPFDAVILAEVIEHVEDPDELLTEVTRRLAADGRLVLTTPIRLLERSLDQYHVHEFWPGELQARLEAHFQDVRLSRMHPVWFVDLMCLRIGRLRPVALLENLLRVGTGIELIDHVPSPLGIFWTQAIVATGPRSKER